MRIRAALKFSSDNLAALGFGVETAAASPPLVGNRHEQATRPGLQAMASPTWGDAGADGTLPVAFTAVWSDAHAPNGPAREGKVHVDFGDGATADVQPDKRQRFVHAFTPGAHTVTLTGKDAGGKVIASRQLVVTVFPQLEPSIEVDGSSCAPRSTAATAASSPTAGTSPTAPLRGAPRSSRPSTWARRS